VGGGGCAYLLTCAPPASPFLLYPLPSPLYPLLTLPYSPLIGCVTSFVVGCVLVVDERERERLDLSRLAEFQTPTIFDRDFDFHRSIFYRSPKIVKIIITFFTYIRMYLQF
jgi:hypothetical protein